MKKSTMVALLAFRTVLVLRKNLRQAEQDFEALTQEAAPEDEAEFTESCESMERIYFPEPEAKPEPPATVPTPAGVGRWGRPDKPGMCNHLQPSPAPSVRCTRLPGHEGDHVSEEFNWRNKGRPAGGVCGNSVPGLGPKTTCQLPRGHVGVCDFM